MRQVNTLPEGTLSVQHLLGIDGLTEQDILLILQTAKTFSQVNDRHLKKVPFLRGHTVANLFFEASTRTRTSFELAAKRLSADTIQFNAGTSSIKKGETLLDTGRTLEAMSPDLVVVRHNQAGAPKCLLKSCPVPSSTREMGHTNIRRKHYSTRSRSWNILNVAPKKPFVA